MAFIFVLLILPSALAKISIELSGKFDGESSDLKLNYYGKDIDIISNYERNTFYLNDNSLKNIVQACIGKRPDLAYLRCPTRWNIYLKYGWQQVIRTLVPKKGKILKIFSQPSLVHKQVFENNSSKPTIFNAGISKDIQNTVSSSWSTGGPISVGEKFHYNFNVELVNVGKSSISYTESWGQNTKQSKTVTIGAKSDIEVSVEPGQSVVYQLYAIKSNIKFEIEYEASLSGISAVSYDTPYKGHHFWGVDIDSCMTNAGLSNISVSREVIDYEFYLDSRIILYGRNFGNKFLEATFSKLIQSK